MKNRYLYTLFLFVGIAFLQACSSTSTTETAPPEPPPQESPRPAPPPPQEPAGPSQAALNALDEAAARAERERKLASDFGAAVYFPEDWEAAETAYGAIRPDRTSPQGAAEAERLYNEAADRYSEIFRRALARHVQDLEDEINQARSEALAAGIADIAPEYLDTADRTAAGARDLFDAGDYYRADEAGREALDRYRALAAGAGAFTLREEIVRLDFSGFDADNFKLGEDAFNAALDAYEGGGPQDALSGASEAKLRFGTALKAGWAAYAAQVRALAQRERQNALNAKADVAVKNDFTAIERIFTQAESSYRREGYEEAVNLYVKSEAGFVALAQAAEEKRRIAQAAIDAAEKKLAESETAAINADEILEGDTE